MGLISSRVCAAVLLVFVVAAASAADRYVSDELSINLRRGPGNDYRITQLLDAGAPVTVIETGDGWTHIRTEGGSDGWVLSRFLSDEPAARTQLAQMRDRVAELEQSNASLREELAQALNGSSELGELKEELTAENKALEQELSEIKDASANAIRINRENQKFREQILSMESEVERLRHENQALQSRRDGMKVGAIILLGGVLLGLVLPLFRRRSRNSWDSI